ncbi:tyrosine-protein phosphatase [Sphingomonas psychrolutea]|uniref:Protein-tyrosine-phosphatase n=1 Tax=Sphingomonas psychrolutea TaxID=1259676 RepID=A0ABQ1GY58_9SPHN|nr:tyrosine-protein phosphatase [Sphingomonas psychrolutea]GGA51745.1 protein-tyrosine-phosphatase [Sphingomonas psychrolutea]
MPQSLTTAPNFRDLGGLPTADGRIVRPGLVFRSEALLEPIDADAAAIIAYGIVLVCDLRSDSERNHAPNDWWAAQGVELLDLDVMAAIEACDGPWLRLRSDRTTAGAIAAMEATYTALPAAALVHLAAIVDRIIAGNLPLLIHCTAGKDRTGFVSAMLLAALGVDHATILADYLDSDGRWTPQVREHTRQMVADQIAEGVPPQAIDAMMGVDERYLTASFSVIDAYYGGIDAYFAAGGVDATRLNFVRAALLC